MRFNLSNAHELCSNGRERLFFLSWEADLDSFEYYCPQVLRDAFPSKEKADAYLTQTVFIPGSTQAVTATDHGDILVWDISLIVDGIAQPNERRLIKVVTFNLMNDPINILTIHNEYLVTGNKDGSIKFYDFQFKICAWFEKLSLNEIKAISFALMEPRQSDPDEDPEKAFKCADFIVADSSALVCKLESTVFEMVDSNSKKGEVIFNGLKSTINAIAVNPIKPMLAIAGKSGFIITWNYQTKETMIN